MDKFGFWSVAIIVFFAEVPCLLRTIAMQIHNKGIWDVVWGTVVGSALVLVCGVLLAKVVQTHVTDKWLRYAEHGSAVILILIGLYLLFNKHGNGWYFLYRNVSV